MILFLSPERAATFLPNLGFGETGAARRGPEKLGQDFPRACPGLGTPRGAKTRRSAAAGTA